MPEIDLLAGPTFPFLVHVGDDTVSWHRLPCKDDGCHYVATLDGVAQIVNDSADVRAGFNGDLRLALVHWSPTAVAYRDYIKHWTDAVRELAGKGPLTMDLPDTPPPAPEPRMRGLECQEPGCGFELAPTSDVDFLRREERSHSDGTGHLTFWESHHFDAPSA